MADLQVANLADAPVPATLAPRTYSGLVDVGPAVAAPGNFHLVVREQQVGDHLHRSTGTTRTVYFDVVEGDRLAQLLS